MEVPDGSITVKSPSEASDDNEDKEEDGSDNNSQSSCHVLRRTASRHTHRLV